ncbi:nuclease-related domain-containing protein [Sporosarcina sp. A2]|uniref:nuclease-related domain-containing protein n=1 Tax=Sporosarcina sp. A2 TaxID=3393449 RepID=UPI003D7B0BBD
MLKALQALEKRMPRSHEKYSYIQNETYRSRAGYAGELEYDRYMKEVRTDYPHAILHDLYLQYEGVYFQIDSLFITPDAVIISEVKNLADKIIITANPTQFVKQSIDGKRKVFHSPIIEVERKIHFLEKWLRHRGMQLEVRGIIVFSHINEMSIEAQPSLPIMTTYEAPAYFRSLIPSERRLDKKAIMKLARNLTAAHRDYIPIALLTRYRMEKYEIRGGVFCVNCESPAVMEWRNLRWECQACGTRDLHSHETAIEEWFMLMPEPLTNRAFCEFTGLTSRHTAKRMLVRSNIQKRGSGRGVNYSLLSK